MTRHHRSHDPESGYALLFVYAMAATVAIMLYMELPRVAFEAQRDKEQLLIDRGEQYSRAVQLYVRKFNRYPPDFDALNNTQNLRFLRGKYVDPMTGKDEWRIIHVGPGGVFTDSVLYTKKKTDEKSDQQNFITELQQVGGNPTDPNQAANLATRRRPSDLPGAQGLPGGQGIPGDPNNPSAPPSVDPSGQPLQNNAPPPEFQPDVQPPNPNAQLPAGVQLPPGAQYPQGVQYPPGVVGPGQIPRPTLGGLPGQLGGLQGQQSALQNQTGQTPSAAANLINQLLTSPRPGGLPGVNNQVNSAGQIGGNGLTIGGSFNQPNQAANNQPGINQPGSNLPGTNLPGTPVANLASPGQGQQIGGGIAGVASKLEREGIKTYRDRTAYNEWEFVYDITKDTSRGGAGQTTPNQGGAGQSIPGQTSPTTSGSSTPTPGTQIPTTPINPPTTPVRPNPIPPTTTTGMPAIGSTPTITSMPAIGSAPATGNPQQPGATPGFPNPAVPNPAVPFPGIPNPAIPNPGQATQPH